MEGLDRFGQFVNRRELAALGRQLGDGERVLAACEARSPQGQRGVLAATDRRLLFVRATLLGGRAQAWAYRDVFGVSRKAGVDDASLAVQRVTGGPVAFTGIKKAEAASFEQVVVSRPRGPGELVDFALPAGEEERRRRLQRLDRMLAQGSLTRAEYERSKRALAEEGQS